MSQPNWNNRRKHTDIVQRRWKREITRTHIPQTKFHNRRQQKDSKQRRSKRNSTRTSISGERFHNRRQKDRYWTEKKNKRMMIPGFIGDNVPKEMMKKAIHY